MKALLNEMEKEHPDIGPASFLHGEPAAFTPS